MSVEYLSNTCSSECFFEYTIECVSGSGVQNPKVYLERNYNDPALPYTIFLVPQEWISKGKDLSYDRIDLVYDVAGIDCGVLTDKKSQDFMLAKPEIEFEMREDGFRRNGCRIQIADTGRYDNIGGVGVIKMFRGKDIVACFYLTINFAFKRRIYYDLANRGSKVDIDFECEHKPVGVNVKLVWNNGRLPCLKNDMGEGKDFVLEFDEKGKCRKQINVGNLGANVKFSVTITDVVSSNYYLLHCRSNSTTEIKNSKIKYHPMYYSCPYCHKPIDNRTDSNPRYKRGGISCGFYDGHGALPIIVNDEGKKAKKCLYCSSDLIENGAFDTDFMRLLPDDYMSHDTFKVAFLGSARAGKTTYISRFFHLFNTSDTTQMDMKMLGNGVGRLGINVKAANIASVIRQDQNGTKYSVTNQAWTGVEPRSFYKNRIIDMSTYAKATVTGGRTERYPFVAEVNNSTYVSFYDVAGEDAETKNMVASIAGGEGKYLGVFCLVSGSKKADGAAAVFEQLMKSNIHKDSPIAVVVTKFDTLLENFDPNCHCLRTDFYDEDKIYADSYLQHEIDHSSEEICSYLTSAELASDLSKKFTNVKYFGISSFNFMESIHSKDESLNDQENKIQEMKFECSPYRLELPFIWMLHQFGIIK